MTKRQTTVISVLVIAVICLSLLVSKRLWFRLDLTKSKMYTISKVSRNLHVDIPDRVSITYYISGKLKAINPMPGEIEDLLREYVSYSRGKIRLTIIDPAKSNLAKQIDQIGIISQQIPTQEQDQISLMTVYSGIVIEYLNNIDVLPWVFSLETLEYDLTSRIRSLVSGNSRMIGVITGDNPNGWNEEYRLLKDTYDQAGYYLRVIRPGQDISDTLTVLLVLGGVEELDEPTLYRIDRYIRMGGKALFTVSAVRIETGGDLSGRVLGDRGLLGMLSLYGVTVLPEIVMDRSALTMQYQTRTPSGALQYRIARYPQWIRILRENGNPSHPANANFSGLDLYWANPLELYAPDGVTAETLFTTTKEAWSMYEPFYTSPDISYLFERDAADTKGTKIIGASLTGSFPSWFAGMPKPETFDETELPDMPEEANSARIIVIGETFFATSVMGVTGGQGNLNFLVQAVGWLSNDDDIIGIRSRQASSGRLDKIVDREKQARAMQFAELANVYIVPLLVVTAGVFFALRRRAKARSFAVVTAGDPFDGEKTENEKELQNDV